jgi:4-amino-4-deoxy-L-arabinose transferase-like glycosyltransferase
MPPATPSRPRSTLLTILLLWLAFYASFTLFTPQLLDDADSVHAEVAREMLLRHDYVTLYANGIRYLEKAPLLYWAMAATMRLFQLLGATSPRALAIAARIPLALTILALALLLEAFARHIFHRPEEPSRGPRTGLYAALILLSSFGIFLFTRILIPDAAVCLFTTLALYAFWRTEELDALPQTPSSRPQIAPAVNPSSRPEAAGRSGETPVSALLPRHHESRAHTRRQFHPRLRLISYHPHDRLRLYCGLFAVACALNVFTKGLIGVVFPVAIVLIYLLLTRGTRRTARRLRELHPWSTFEAFLFIAAPWHILAGLANPAQGHPAPFRFVNLHWIVPLPTDGNVHGWFWFYFMNEHLLRYLNLRVPHDYDTSPLWLFWGLCFLWMMPWSAFVFKATAWAAPCFGKSHRTTLFRSQLRRHDLPLQRRGALLLLVWAAFVLLFFAFSTRQEYYVLPALPALSILIAAWLAQDSLTPNSSAQSNRPNTSSPQPDAPTTLSSRPKAAHLTGTTSTRPSLTEALSSRPEAAHVAAAAERPLYPPSSTEPPTPGLAANTQVPRGFSLGSHSPAKGRGFSPGAVSAATRCTTILLLLGSLFAAAALTFLIHTRNITPTKDLAALLQQNPSDYALSMGHFLDLTGPALILFRVPLALAALSLFLGPLIAFILRRKARPHAANISLAAGAFTFLLAAHLGLQTFAPVLTSAQLAKAIAPQVQGPRQAPRAGVEIHPDDLIVIHGEYESGSTLGFYLQRPSAPGSDIHILEGRSSNLWYGSFFSDAPAIFETPASLAQKWSSPQRIFLWQSLTAPPNQLPLLPAPVYILVKSGGKEILSNQPNP